MMVAPAQAQAYIHNPLSELRRGRTAGMALKSAADAVGKPIYLEMSSINPVVILPGALAERGAGERVPRDG